MPFYLQPAPMDLIKEHGDLIAAIRELDGAPVAVVLDTLNRSLTGSENSDEDMGAYIRATDAIREAFDCSVLVVHHCGNDGSKPRGHTSLTGAADARLAVRRDHAKNVLVDVEFMKDGESGDTIVSALETVEVGSDEDGGRNHVLCGCSERSRGSGTQRNKTDAQSANNAGRAGEGREATLKRRVDRASN